MLDQDTQSVVIDIPVPKVFAKTEVKKKQVYKGPLKKIIRSEKRSSSIQQNKYHISEELPLSSKLFQRDELIIPYKLYAKIQDYDRNQRKLKIHIKNQYKIKSTRMAKRLHTDCPPDDVDTVCEFDSEFFTCLNGNVFDYRMPLFKSQKFLLNDQLRLRQEIGYRHDCVLNIKNNYRNDLDRYHLAVQRYKTQVKYLDTFIAEDYKKSRELLEKCDELNIKVDSKQSELENLAFKKFTIVSKIIGIDYKYSVQQKYGRFLYYLSPPSWRSKHRDFAQSIEIEAKGFDYNVSSEEDTFNAIFEKLQKECLSHLVKPPIYFRDPCDLMNVFETIEKQQLHHFCHVTYLAPHIKTVRDKLKYMKHITAKDSTVLANIIESFEFMIKFAEERSAHLQAKFFKVLNGLFYENVGAPEVLKLYVHLEFCIEKLFGERPANMDVLTMAKLLEGTYMDYSQKLEAIHSGAVRKAVLQYIELQRQKMRKARQAARDLRSFARLENELLQAFSFSTSEQYQNLPIKKAKNKSAVSNDKSKKRESRRSLTEAELEYLSLFTNWNATEDPAKYLHSLNLEEGSKDVCTKSN